MITNPIIDLLIILAIVVPIFLLLTVKGRRRLVTYVISGLVLGIVTFVVAALLQVALIQQIVAAIFVALIFGAISSTPWPIRRRGLLYQPQTISIPPGTKRRVIAAVLALLVIAVAFGWQWGAYSPVANANYLQNQLQMKSTRDLFANQSLPIDAIPLVSQAYASYIAQSHVAADFGGSAQIVDSEQVVYAGQPYWIFTIASTNTFTQNYEKGFILVNAVNASYTQIQQRTAVGPGLCGICLSSIDIQTWFKDTTKGIGNWYPQPTSQGAVQYVVTRNAPQWDGSSQFSGGLAYTPDGSVALQYSGVSAPETINQPWDRELLTKIASQWGDNRIGPSSFWVCAGGCIFWQASSYRLQLASEYELIPYNESTALLLFFSPANSPNSLAGVMLASRSSIYYYDLHLDNFISPTAAGTAVRGALPTVPGGALVPVNPILYPIGGQFAWIIPYFFSESASGNVLFKGIGIVSAQNVNRMVLVPGTDVVATRDAAIVQFLTGTNQTYVGNTATGIITHTMQYEQGGNSVVAVKLNSTNLWYFATPNNLPPDQWYTMLNLQVGQNVTLTTTTGPNNQLYIVNVRANS